MAARAPSHETIPTEQDKKLLEIQDRVLWLAMQMVHHANHVRPSLDGSKVGGAPGVQRVSGNHPDGVVF